MSGGGGGPIIINRLIGEPISTEDNSTLQAIADRSVVRCSFMDTVTVFKILWKYLRKS